MEQRQIVAPTRDEVSLVFTLARHGTLGDPDAIRIVNKVVEYQRALWMLADQRRSEGEQQPPPPPEGTPAKGKGKGTPVV